MNSLWASMMKVEDEINMTSMMNAVDDIILGISAVRMDAKYTMSCVSSFICNIIICLASIRCDSTKDKTDEDNLSDIGFCCKWQNEQNFMECQRKSIGGNHIWL